MLFEATVLLGGKLIMDSRKESELKNRTVDKDIRSGQMLADSVKERAKEEEKLLQETKRLYTRKKAICDTTIMHFYELYKKVILINFKKSDGIAEMEFSNPICYDNWKNEIQIIQQPDFEPATLNIKTVTSFLFFGIMGVASSTAVEDAKHSLEIARSREKQARIIAEQHRIESISYRETANVVRKETDVLTELNRKLNYSIKCTDAIVTQNGKDRSQYSQQQIRQVATCINLAKAVKDIIDAPVIDPKGEMTLACKNAIEKGSQCIADMQSAIQGL